MKKELEVKFYLSKHSDEFPIYKCTEYSGKFETHIRFADLDDVDGTVIRLIKESYNL